MYAELPDFVGEYRITGLLGEGAVARVYAGTEPGTLRSVAIKVLREGHSPEHRTVERFIAEVRAVKQIQHRNIIDIYGFGALPDGRPFFVMEYLPGLTLQQRLDREGPLTFLEAAPIFAQACAALSAAHEHGIIHRDLKPDNIYLADERSGPPLVKLLDFGIAKLVTQQSSAALTQVGSTVGTPLYMSPEQIRALPLDPRSDIYTLGVSLFQTLTGEFPFYAESHAQTATMHLTQAPPLPSQVSDLLPIPEQAEVIVMRCLEKNPDARYSSMDELRQALEATARDLMSARKLSGGREARVSLPSVPPLPPGAPIPLSAEAALAGPHVAVFSPPVPSTAGDRPPRAAAETAFARLDLPHYPPLTTPVPGSLRTLPSGTPRVTPAATNVPAPSQSAPVPAEGQRQTRAARPAPTRRPVNGNTGKVVRYVAWYVLMVALGVLLWLVLSRFFHWPLR